MKATVIQTCSQHNKSKNLTQVRQLIEQAIIKDKTEFVALPEMFNYHGGELQHKERASETLPKPNQPTGSQTYNFLKTTAKQCQIIIHGGSILEKSGNNYYNTTLVFDKNGHEIARYRKIHLFDVTTPDGKTYKESDDITPGDKIVKYQIEPFNFGCAICYDIRFSQLFQLLSNEGANVMVIPSSFTYSTGKTHWECLLRTRAIETQSYVLAPAQTGFFIKNGKKYQTWGHSMIIGPWGEILAQMKEEIGFATADISLEYLTKIRTHFPTLQHQVL